LIAAVIRSIAGLGLATFNRAAAGPWRRIFAALPPSAVISVPDAFRRGNARLALGIGRDDGRAPPARPLFIASRMSRGG
jgi:hypothetical protein